METPLAAQSQASVFSKEEQIIAFVNAAYPTVDLSPGTVLRDLVVKLYAHLEVRIQEQIDLALISSSLMEISKNPNVVDALQVERVLSNFNVVRGEGSKAAGTLRLFFSSSASVIVGSETVFNLNGVSFIPSSSYVLVVASSYIGSSVQRILEPTGSLYSVTIEVVAVESGSAGNIASATLMSGVSPPLTGLVSAKADSDFIGGADTDDNTTMLTKAKDGVVGKVFGGRAHIKAKLKTQFAGIKDVGVVGFLDPEMTRDLVDGVHLGNRVDLYVKSSSYPSRVSEKIKVTVVSYDVINQEVLFEIKLPAAKAAGLYTIESVRSNLSQAASFEVGDYDVRTLEGNTLHLITGDNIPNFTAYQRITIRFKASYVYMIQSATTAGLAYIANNSWDATSEMPADAVSASASGGLFYFFIEYLRMPNLVEIQGYVDSAKERNLSADVLVRAPVPIMCSLQLRLLKPVGAEDVDMLTLKAALVSKFNSFEMGQNIPATALIHVAYQNLPTGYVIDSPIHMYGVIINPDLTKDVLYSADTLRAPKNYSKGATPNTCAFFLESSLIDISVVECL